MHLKRSSEPAHLYRTQNLRGEGVITVTGTNETRVWTSNKAY
jgi:hypothetical protein